MNILITGGTGFLGKELKRHFIKERYSNIYILGRNEKKLSEIKKDISESEQERVHAICGDIKDYDSIYAACKPNNIDIMIHAAALKRIDVCQDNPIEANKTNVEGTINCIKVCKELKIELCFISTDKACEPCTTYGATKYLAEQLVRRESQRSKELIGYVVRYGNVLNSTGSVLCIWEKQYKDTGKVCVRDKDMTRFFWSVEESVKYIEECIMNREDKHGNVFIPEIKAMNIYEMAAHLYGEENIEVTRSSHTEKTHEWLDGNTCSKDYVVHPKEYFK